MGHPAIAAVGVVFDEDEAAAGAQMAYEPANDGAFIPMEVEGVGHDETVERRQLEGAGEIGVVVVDGDAGEAACHAPPLALQSAVVLIDGVNGPTRTEEVGEGQGKGPVAGAEVGPATAFPGHGFR